MYRTEEENQWYTGLMLIIILRCATHSVIVDALPSPRIINSTVGQAITQCLKMGC